VRERNWIGNSSLRLFLTKKKRFGTILILF